MSPHGRGRVGFGIPSSSPEGADPTVGPPALTPSSKPNHLQAPPPQTATPQARPSHGPRWWHNSVHCTSVELEILLWHSSTHSFIWKFSGNLSLFTSSFFKKISFSYAAVRMATAHFASLDHNNESFHERGDGGILLFINPLNRDWENFLMKRASHLSVGAF